MFNEGLLVLSRVGALVAVYLLFFHYLRSLQDIYWTIRLYMACAAIVVAVAVGQYLILGHPVLTSTFRNIHALGQIIPGGVWGLENPWLDEGSTGHEQLGAFMILVLAVVGGGILYRWPIAKGWRRAAISFWVVGVFVLLLCSSRGAWIGAVCAAAACCWLAVIRRRTDFVYRGVLALGLMLGVLYFTGFNFAFHIGERLDKLPALLDGKTVDESAKHRLNYLKVLTKMFEQKPLVGWGAGSAGRIAEGQIQRELVEGGVLGGALFIWAVGMSLTIAVKANRIASFPFAKGLSFGYICGLTGLMGQALFTELFILPKVIIPFWVVGAMVHRLYFIERDSPAPVVSPPSRGRSANFFNPGVSNYGT